MEKGFPVKVVIRMTVVLQMRKAKSSLTASCSGSRNGQSWGHALTCLALPVLCCLERTESGGEEKVQKA